MNKFQWKSTTSESCYSSFPEIQATKLVGRLCGLARWIEVDYGVSEVYFETWGGHNKILYIWVLDTSIRSESPR